MREGERGRETWEGEEGSRREITFAETLEGERGKMIKALDLTEELPSQISSNPFYLLFCGDIR